MEDVVGEQLVFPFINNVLKPMTEAFKTMAQWGAANPVPLKLIAEGFTALGGALVVVGGITVLTAVFGTGGLIAVAVLALGALAAINWKGMTANLEAANPSLTALPANVSVLSLAFQKVGDLFQWLSDKLSATFGWMFHGASPTGGAMLGDPGHVRHMITESNLHSSQRKILSGLGHGQYADLIRARGAALGYDPSNLLKIYGTEGASSYYGDYVNGKPTSFGPFQMHFPGMANKLLAAGIDVRNPSTVGAQIDWMYRYGAQHGGYSSDIWHGLRGHGGSLPAPRSMLPPQKQSMVIHNHIYMDGKKIASNTVKHLVSSARYPTSVGRQDGRGQFMGPGAEVFA